MNLQSAFMHQPRSWVLAEMIVALIIIGVLDLITGYQFRLLPLYAGPIFVVAWFVGKKYGILTALLSALVWLCATWLNGDPDLRSWVAVWEICRHFGFFLIVAWTGSALRTKSDSAAARIALLEHSQRLEREVVNISETEQRRIGQDLHDGLCQYLAALTCSATSLRDDLRKLHLTAEANSADELAKLLQEAVVQTRDLARGLVPRQVEQVGIIVALQSLAQSVSRLQGIGCTFRLNGRVAECDEATAVHLYRIAQEAISNATKHGKATRIAISIEALSDLITLRVWDNGTGISGFVATGTGLGTMRYRANLSGGELTVEQPDGGGTLVSCTVRRKPRKDEIAAA